MTKIFIAGISIETNTFLLAQTGEDCFNIIYGDDTLLPEKLNAPAMPIAIFEKRAKENKWNVKRSLCAIAVPGGVVEKKTYEKFRQIIFSDLQNEISNYGKVDAIFLNLHGAMVAVGYDDCEGDLLEQIRNIAGKDVPIFVELDLHANVSKKMVANSNVILCYKEYPHIDIGACANQLFDLMMLVITGKIRPVTAIVDCRMVGLFPTDCGVMKSFVDEIKNIEKNDEDVLAISIAHGFPWSDVECMGAKIIVVTNNNVKKADLLAKHLAEKMFNMRDEISIYFNSLDEAIETSQKTSQKPLIMADFADNPGGGAPGNATFVLKYFLDHNVGSAALGVFYSPATVKEAIKKGEGDIISFDLGGGQFAGEKIILTGVITKIVHDLKQQYRGGSLNMHDVVAIKLDNDVHIIVGNLRQQVYSTDCFTKVGINLHDKNIIVVKSGVHFRDSFGQFKIVTLNTDGALNPNFYRFSERYSKINFPKWPFDECVDKTCANILLEKGV